MTDIIEKTASELKSYAIFWRNSPSYCHEMGTVMGKDEHDALRNYAAENNLRDEGWVIENARLGGIIVLRRYSDDLHFSEMFALRSGLASSRMG